ncbi:fungal-specific transcription factor domain-containing protein [Aspergillus keveii]|uniref:Fungal-specific transcription factor domain-containing protein n=1 Tax=Aspergillus keveii TaxID=714993 RepID=A0ABR4GM50_9EURO
MATSLALTPPPLDLDPLELSILERRGTFGLPPRQISDHLVNVFFSLIAPTLPVVDQDDFMRAYHGSGCDLSLLLLQAIYTIASRSFGGHGDLEDPDLTPRAFYKEAKALYDAGYEQNPTAILQAVVLLSVYWDGPDDLRESGIFYWSHIGIALAQTQGLHTTERYSLLDPADKGLLKRIWWTLYTRDRSVAAAFGRPAHINLADCTVEPLTEEDFVHSGSAQQTHARYFLQYIKLCQIMDLGPCVNLASRAAGPRPRRDVEAARCELKLHEWLASCPMEFLWRPAAHSFWAAMLQSVFHTIVCQLHLSQKQSSRSS